MASHQSHPVTTIIEITDRVISIYAAQADYILWISVETDLFLGSVCLLTTINFHVLGLLK
jgi:hypothetical protein